MFWDDSASGEAIAPLREAVLSDGAPHADFIATHPNWPFSPRGRSAPQASAA